jgi:hypothetical protein
MTRYIFTLPRDRRKCKRALLNAPEGTRVELKGARRSNDQNALMWAMLTDIATQKEHFGKRYPTDTWKILFMHGWQKEVRMIPSLDGTEVLPLTRSSDLSKGEMSELLEFMMAWGTENGVTFHDTPARADAA